MLSLIDSSAFWTQLATFALAVAIWADRHIDPSRTEYEALEWRLRHPVQSALRTPVATVKRQLDRRVH